MKLKALAILALAALSLALAACGGGSDDSTGGGETSAEGSAAADVEIVEFAYQPEPVVVEVGGTVTWTNEDTAPHTATADDGSFDTGEIDEGKLKSETFKEAGEFTYFCSVHPNMHGTIRVVPES